MHQKLFEVEGLEVRFMYYSSGNGVSDNAINLLLINKNEHSINYSFELIFKSEEKEKIKLLEGHIKANEIKTGSNSNLFFLPFDDGSKISHLGATKIKVKKKASNSLLK